MWRQWLNKRLAEESFYPRMILREFGEEALEVARKHFSRPDVTASLYLSKTQYQVMRNYLYGENTHARHCS